NSSAMVKPAAPRGACLTLRPIAARHRRAAADHQDRRGGSRSLLVVAVFLSRGAIQLVDAVEQRVHEHATNVGSAVAGDNFAQPSDLIGAATDKLSGEVFGFGLQSFPERGGAHGFAARRVGDKFLLDVPVKTDERAQFLFRGEAGSANLLDAVRAE